MFNILNTGVLKLNLRIICSKTDPKNLWEWDQGKLTNMLMVVLLLHILIFLVYIQFIQLSVYMTHDIYC